MIAPKTLGVRRLLMTFTKDRLVSAVQEQQDISGSKASATVETILELMKGTLANGEDLLISGFGKFSVRGKNERKGRNPATGTPMPLRSRRVVVFRCSPVLKGKLNGGDCG